MKWIINMIINKFSFNEKIFNFLIVHLLIINFVNCDHEQQPSEQSNPLYQYWTFRRSPQYPSSTIAPTAIEYPSVLSLPPTDGHDDHVQAIKLESVTQEPSTPSTTTLLPSLLESSSEQSVSKVPAKYQKVDQNQEKDAPKDVSKEVSKVPPLFVTTKKRNKVPSTTRRPSGHAMEPMINRMVAAAQELWTSTFKLEKRKVLFLEHDFYGRAKYDLMIEIITKPNLIGSVGAPKVIECHMYTDERLIREVINNEMNLKLKSNPPKSVTNQVMKSLIAKCQQLNLDKKKMDTNNNNNNNNQDKDQTPTDNEASVTIKRKTLASNRFTVRSVNDGRSLDDGGHRAAGMRRGSNSRSSVDGGHRGHHHRHHLNNNNSGSGSESTTNLTTTTTINDEANPTKTGVNFNSSTIISTSSTTTESTPGGDNYDSVGGDDGKDGDNNNNNGGNKTSTTSSGIFNGLAIYPGTKWCGAGDIAKNDSDLGHDKGTDSCCRDHDKCFDNIAPGQTKYNLTNSDQYTKSHCSCDEKFAQCLKDANSFVGHQVGRLYFNVIQIQCFREDYPIINCTEKKGFFFNNFRTTCQDYNLDRSKSKKWQFFDPPFYDGSSGPLFNIPILSDAINKPISQFKDRTINGGIVGSVIGR